MINKKRIAQVQQQLKKNKINALLVTKAENLFYLFGYGEEGSAALIAQNGWGFFASVLNFPEVKKAVADCRPLTVENLRQYVKESRLLLIGVEANSLTLSGFRSWRRIFRSVTLVETRDLVEELRLVKTALEISALKKAIAITDRIYQRIETTLKPGLTEQALAGQIDELIRKEGAEPGFKTIVASGASSSCPHHLSSNKRLKNGEMVMLDFGVRFAGYHSDLTRTIFLGKISKKFSQNYELVRKAQSAAIKQVKAGVSVKTVDDAARQTIAQAGAGKYFTHTTGHGVGLEVHEAPRLSTQDKTKLAAGMVVTVEPGVYIPGWGGIRIEDVVLVTKNGCRVLSKSKK